MEEKSIESVLQYIKDSEMILVGIGKEFSLPWEDSGEPKELEPYRRSLECEKIPVQHEIFQAYQGLIKLLGHKPYFVVTLNTDGLIWRTGLNTDSIVAPCGDLGKMQCGSHIVEASSIRDKVLTKIYGYESTAGQENYIRQIIKETAVCPECGQPLVFHTVEQEGYQEEGYLSQWAKYKKWLQATLNRKLCVLELGVGFEYPQVVRWPFEKTVFYNKKGTLVRISGRYPQVPEEIAERSLSVSASPVSFLKDFRGKTI